MIGNYSAAIAWAEYQAKKKKKKPTKEIEDCRKNVIKCNRSGKLSYCKPTGGEIC